MCNNACDKKIDPDDVEYHISEEELNENGLWECTQEVKENEKTCIFHKSVDQKDNSKVQKVLSDLIDTKDRLEIYEPIFGRLDLSEKNIEAKLEFIGAIFEDRVDFTGTTFEGTVNLSNATFEDTVDFTGATFKDAGYFRLTTFETEASFYHVIFGDRVNFSNATFEDKEVFFQYTTFEDEVGFRGITFENKVYLFETTFEDTVTFVDTTFEGEVDFNYTKFKDEVYFSYTKFGNRVDTTFEGEVDFRGVKFGGRVDFRGITFEDRVDFTGTTFEEYGNFMSAVFTDNVSFNRASLCKVDFRGIDINYCNFEEAVLDRCVFFESDLRGSRWYGSVFRDVRINSGTRLLGSPEGGDSKRVVYDEKYGTDGGFLGWLNNICVGFMLFWFILLNFVTSNSWYSVVEDRVVSFGGSDGSIISIDKARDVYKSIENLGRQSGLGNVQSTAFVKRQDINAREYLLEGLDGDSRSDRFWGFMRYCRARVARFSLLYGESPWRILGVGLLCILVFSVLYPLGGWLKPVGGSVITYGRVLEEPLLFFESVYFSTLTFTTLGLGDYVPVGFGRVLVAFNTVSGAVLVALLVFVLGRRAAR